MRNGKHIARKIQFLPYLKAILIDKGRENLMFKTLFIALLTFMMAVPTMARADDSDGMTSDTPAVALFYADWCGSCKILEPKLEKAKAALKDKNAIDWVVFDLTNEETKAQSVTLAASKNLSTIYADHAPKTGFAMLVRGDRSGEPVMITKKDSVEEMQDKLNALIGS